VPTRRPIRANATESIFNRENPLPAGPADVGSALALHQGAGKL